MVPGGAAHLVRPMPTPQADLRRAAGPAAAFGMGAGVGRSQRAPTAAAAFAVGSGGGDVPVHRFRQETRDTAAASVEQGLLSAGAAQSLLSATRPRQAHWNSPPSVRAGKPRLPAARRLTIHCLAAP